MAAIDEIRTAVATVADRLAASVVGVRGGRGAGSGIVTADGQVLTNAHNTGRGDVPGEVEVTFADGRRAPGTVTAADLDGDLAVIEVDTAGAIPVTWRDDDPVTAIGDVVFGVANPAGRGVRVTMGLVSAVDVGFRGPGGRRINGSVEHTAPLARGSSGGPVVDAEGRLLGINTNRIGDGFYLAVPADASLRGRVEALGRGQAPARPRLGVGLAPAHVAARLREAVGLEPRDGLLVQTVEEGSAAQAAGLRRGDLLVGAGGRQVRSADDLFDVLGDAAGAMLLEVVRGSEPIIVEVALAP